MSAREKALEAREADAERLLAKAKTDSTVAAKTRADLERRLEAVRSAAA